MALPLIQVAPAANFTAASTVTPTFAAGTKAGSLLYCAVYTLSAITVSSFPAGWQKIVTESSSGDLELWVYFGNPGAITSVAINLSGTGTGCALMGELIGSYRLLDQTGSATGASGSVSVTTGGNLAHAREMQILACWDATATATWTPSFTDIQNGSNGVSADLAILVSPSTSGAAATATDTPSVTTLGWHAVIATFYMPAAPQAILDQGPVSYWRLNEPSGQTKAWDSSGGNRNGTNGTGLTLGGTGPVAADPSGGAYTFDGTANAKSTINDAAALHLSSWTIIGWVSPNGTQAQGACILGDAFVGNQVNYFLGFSADGTNFNGGNSAASTQLRGGEYNGGYDITGSQQLGPGGWQWAALTMDGVTLRLYVNGQQVGTAAASHAATGAAGSKALGTDWAAVGFLKGLLSEVAIFGSALSPTTIQSLYATTPPAQRYPLALAPAFVAAQPQGFFFTRWTPILNVAGGAAYQVVLSVVSVSVPAINKAVAKAWTVPTLTVSSFQKTIAKGWAVVTTSTPSTRNDVGKSWLVTTTSSPSFQKAVGKVLAVTTTSIAAVQKAVGKVWTVVTTTAPSLQRGVGKELDVTSTSTPVFRKAIGKILSVVTATVPAVQKGTGKILGATSTNAPSMAKGVGKTLAVTSSSAPSAQKGVTKGLAVTTTSTPAVQKAIAKTWSVSSLSVPAFTTAVAQIGHLFVAATVRSRDGLLQLASRDGLRKVASRVGIWKIRSR